MKRDRDVERAIHLLRRDVAATVGHEHDSEVVRLATNVLEFYEPPHVTDKIVEEVQQYLHDTFVDTSWPACPRHRSHPLWFLRQRVVVRAG